MLALTPLVSLLTAAFFRIGLVWARLPVTIEADVIGRQVRQDRTAQLQDVDAA
jgi:hypothetical protein